MAADGSRIPLAPPESSPCIRSHGATSPPRELGEAWAAAGPVKGTAEVARGRLRPGHPPLSGQAPWEARRHTPREQAPRAKDLRPTLGHHGLGAHVSLSPGHRPSRSGVCQGRSCPRSLSLGVVVTRQQSAEQQPKTAETGIENDTPVHSTVFEKVLNGMEKRAVGKEFLRVGLGVGGRPHEEG